MADSEKTAGEVVSEAREVKKKKSVSMHEDIPVWYDCCSCEAEPYWVEAMNAEVTDNDKP